MNFDRWEYYRGKRGVKYGVFNTYRNCFQFNIAEDTPFLAKARLFTRIGQDYTKRQFVIRAIPDKLLPKIQKERLPTEKQYGIWNTARKEFQFGISEDSGPLAEARLFQKIGDDARKWRFEIRELKKR